MSWARFFLVRAVVVGIFRYVYRKINTRARALNCWNRIHNVLLMVAVVLILLFHIFLDIFFCSFHTSFFLVLLILSERIAKLWNFEYTFFSLRSSHFGAEMISLFIIGEIFVVLIIGAVDYTYIKYNSYGLFWFFRSFRLVAAALSIYIFTHT